MAGDPVEGIVAYGSTVEVKIGGGSYVYFDGLYELTVPPVTIANIESPQMNLPDDAMLRIAGKVKNYGQSTFGLVWQPGSAADALIDSLLEVGEKFSVRVTHPNGAFWVYDGLIASATPATPWDDRLTCAVVLDTTGIVEKNAAASPVNELKPAISGVLTVGQVLHAWPGQWAGGGKHTYQWKNAGVNLVGNGATTADYTLQGTDSGDAITVVVTTTNSAGSANATSAAVVIA